MKTLDELSEYMSIVDAGMRSLVDHDCARNFEWVNLVLLYTKCIFPRDVKQIPKFVEDARKFAQQQCIISEKQYRIFCALMNKIERRITK